LPLADLSIVYRYKALIGGWNMILAKFPAGVGWENFRFVLPEYVDSAVPNMVAHNTYLAGVAELGLPGLIALVGFLSIIYRHASLAARQSGMRGRRLAQGVRMALAAALVGSLFLGTLGESLLWVVVGLIMAQNEVGAEGMSRPGIAGDPVPEPGNPPHAQGATVVIANCR
jgi:hypothetical protein